MKKIRLIKTIQDIEINREKFPYTSKVLLVTGLSGSGKSYLAKKLEKEYNATSFQVEWLIHSKHVSDECKNILETFLLENPEIVPYVNNKWNNCKIEDENELLKKYINKFFLFFLQNKNPHKLYIIEGLQLFTLIDFELIKDFPIIIKGTSSFRSLKNRLKRDLSKHKNEKIRYFFKAIRQSKLYQFKHRKVLNKFIKKINEGE